MMALTKAQIAMQRLDTQRLIEATFSTPAEVVRWFGAVQAQEYPACLWALALRLPAMTEADVEAAVADGSLVRTWPMRGTVHFVPPEDARWMVNLLAPRVTSKMRGMYAKSGLDDDTYARGRAIIAHALRDGQPVRRVDLYAKLREAGIDTGTQRGVFIASRMAHEGLICMGPRIGKQPSFVWMDAWIKESCGLSPEESAIELARRYFTSHGPATLHDFTWWTGLRINEARPAINALGAELDSETVDGKTYYWATANPPQTRESSAYVLPPFDEYLVSYTDRSASLNLPHVQWPRFDAIGNFVLVSGGQVIGTIERTTKRERVTITPTLFRTLRDDEERDVSAAIARYVAFLGVETDVAAWQIAG
jgi:hypothetical protein